jgi:hypothetical protein
MSIVGGTKEAKEYRPPRLSDDQIKCLEYLIAVSKNATSFAKKVIIWLLHQTENLTKQVALSVPDEFLGEPSRQIQNGEHDMCSSNGTTHIGTILGAAGTQMSLMGHCGRFSENFFCSDIGGCTIWFAYVFYSRDAELVDPPTIEDLEKIDLEFIINPFAPKFTTK